MQFRDISAVLRSDDMMQSFLQDIFHAWIDLQHEVPRVGLVRYTGELELTDAPMFAPDVEHEMADRAFAFEVARSLVHDEEIDASFVGLSLLGIGEPSTPARSASRQTALATLLSRNGIIYNMTFSVPAEAMPPAFEKAHENPSQLLSSAQQFVKAIHSELLVQGKLR